LDGLADIIRLIELTRLKHVDFIHRDEIFFQNKTATQHFITRILLSTTLERIPGIESFTLRRLFRSVASILGHNESIAQVGVLLARPLDPEQQQQQPPRHGSTSTTTTTSLFLIKTWHKAIAKFAMAGGPIPGSNAGASAIFKLITARSQLLEKRLQQPTTTATITTTTSTAVSQAQKRRRL
jgi:hypothetical protein